ncbi:venom phosphodiesterase CdcPDE-like isoform X2 [Rhopilema esculentum]|uniref:venom phosphodiesterase CdcPDE-like isoform X2 n=1 Tax=Rhopilema esculentum TaxID=499914 RepID=UPI0031E189AE
MYHPSFSRPALILVYLDGFRADYLDGGYSPTINSLAKSGIRAKRMRSQFPTKSYPNLRSIVTGLYPESHGIVGNSFLSGDKNESFAYWTSTSKEGKWWLGEPIWTTAKKQGVKSAVYYFWSENIEKDKQPDYWVPYDGGKANFSSRVDQALRWLDMDPSTRPYFISLYAAYPDTPGHKFGPDSSQNNAGIKRVDDMVGELVNGIEKRGLVECTNIIIVSDHGMSNISCSKSVYLDTMIPVHNISVNGTGPFMAIYTKNKDDANAFVKRMKCKSNFQAFSKYDKFMPKRWHYSNNKRIGDIIVVPDVGWTVYPRTGSCTNESLGQHGYDNIDPLMSAIFVANGPSFKQGILADEFSNIEIYNLMAEILRLKPAANNGTSGSLSYFLKNPLKAVKQATAGDGNNFTMDCKFPKNYTEARLGCSKCACYYCHNTIYWNQTVYRKNLDLSNTEIQKALETHLPLGIPQGGAGKQGCVLTQRHYVIGYSGYLHVPLWVAYKMTAKQLSINIKRMDCFRRDLRLTRQQSAMCSDYSRSGYDRGHMAPSGDFNFDRFAAQDTYVLSNIVPQSRYFNRRPGLWYQAESVFRDWAMKYDSVYVISGSIFDADNDGFRDKDEQTKRWTHDKKNGVAIPTHFYKIIVRCDVSNTTESATPGCGGTLKAMSFVFPHNEEKGCQVSQMLACNHKVMLASFRHMLALLSNQV